MREGGARHQGRVQGEDGLHLRLCGLRKFRYRLLNFALSLYEIPNNRINDIAVFAQLLTFLRQSLLFRIFKGVVADCVTSPYIRGDDSNKIRVKDHERDIYAIIQPQKRAFYHNDCVHITTLPLLIRQTPQNRAIFCDSNAQIPTLRSSHISAQ